MTGLGRVLAPLDGTPQAEAALQWLRLLPMQHLTLLRVCEPEPGAIDRAERYLHEIAQERLAPGCAIDTRVVSGGAAESIVEAATGMDLVVMSTRGAGGGGRLLFGSVADLVARHAPAPTLLLRGGRAPVSAAALLRVVVPLDGSPAAERALPLARPLAEALSATLHLVTVEQEGGGAGDSNTSAIPEYLERLARNLAVEEVAWEHRNGDPATELLAVVRPGDLLVITTHGSGAARRWQIGRVAEKLLRQAAAPVVLVRVDSPD